jgi:epoxyqueuosine reductase
MAYMARAPEERADAASALGGAGAVLVVALSYPPDTRDAAPPPGHARVSTYAQSPYDYHRVLAMRLNLLEELYADLVPGGRARRFCDTTPLLERAFAYLAGLGFVGKNTQLINRERGSYFFLGGVVVDRALPPDTPDALGSCGSCTRCLESCPTDAFPAPWVLDARRCISYLTIEHRGAVDPTLREGIGAHLFGCDVCQAVCPWNVKFAPPGDPQLQPESARVDPSLAELYPVARDRFKSIGRHTPWGRTGKRGFLRNLATVMGNAGGPQCSEPLAELAAHDDPAVAEHARWAQGRLSRRESASGGE